MLTRILGKIGLPMLVKLVSSALGKIPNETAQSAAEALSGVNEAIKTEKISLEELKEANRHLEREQELENTLDESTLHLIHETIKHELQSEDKFVRFWRPAFGYSVAFTWLLCMLTICYVVVTDNPRATDIIMSLVETTSLWGIALGVLGISVVRTGDNKTTLSPHRLMNKFTLTSKH